jgi:hypothetical protein
MSQQEQQELFERTMKMLKPALERVASDPEFRNRLELNPLQALAEMKVELDADTRRELEGRRFSEFWALRRQSVQGPIGVRDMPPEDGLLTDEQLDKVAGGMRGEIGRFAPPYVPV